MSKVFDLLIAYNLTVTNDTPIVTGAYPSLRKNDIHNNSNLEKQTNLTLLLLLL